MKKTLISTLALLMAALGAKAQTAPATAQRPEVLIETTMGNIRLQLYNETPQHRDNFLKLIRTHHFYDSLLFHRVIPAARATRPTPSDARAAPSSISSMARCATRPPWSADGRTFDSSSATASP